jgi:hypothetical protein
MKRILSMLVVVALAAPGCSLSPTEPVASVRELVGPWRGPFHGVIVVIQPGRLRYQGSRGNGTVMVTRRDDQTTVRLVPDGGGGGGAFTRTR